nr:MAG TPA: hypothetical protein [Caudoviricetes sp.]
MLQLLPISIRANRLMGHGYYSSSHLPVYKRFRVAVVRSIFSRVRLLRFFFFPLIVASSFLWYC